MVIKCDDYGRHPVINIMRNVFDVYFDMIGSSFGLQGDPLVAYTFWATMGVFGAIIGWIITKD